MKGLAAATTKSLRRASLTITAGSKPAGLPRTPPGDRGGREFVHLKLGISTVIRAQRWSAAATWSHCTAHASPQHIQAARGHANSAARAHQANSQSWSNFHGVSACLGPRCACAGDMADLKLWRTTGETAHARMRDGVARLSIRHRASQTHVSKSQYKTFDSTDERWAAAGHAPRSCAAPSSAIGPHLTLTISLFATRSS